MVPTLGPAPVPVLRTADHSLGCSYRLLALFLLYLNSNDITTLFVIRGVPGQRPQCQRQLNLLNNCLSRAPSRAEARDKCSQMLGGVVPKLSTETPMAVPDCAKWCVIMSESNKKAGKAS